MAHICLSSQVADVTFLVSLAERVQLNALAYVTSCLQTLRRHIDRSRSSGDMLPPQGLVQSKDYHVGRKIRVNLRCGGQLGPFLSTFAFQLEFSKRHREEVEIPKRFTVNQNRQL